MLATFTGHMIASFMLLNWSSAFRAYFSVMFNPFYICSTFQVIRIPFFNLYNLKKEAFKNSFFV